MVLPPCRKMSKQSGKKNHTLLNEQRPQNSYDVMKNSAFNAEESRGNYE
ncbi:MAG: hypothetical protein ACJZ2N_02550 [Candidatus Poseidoniales archaeon]